MSARAYLLIEVVAGRSEGIVEALRQNPGVKSAIPVFGPVDIVAELEAEDQKAITDLLHSHVHSLPGIARTTTCFVIGPRDL